MIVIFHKVFADDARAIMERSVKQYLLHSCFKILSSVNICKVPNDAYIKTRIKV